MRKKKPNILIRMIFDPKVFALGLLAILIAISIPISKNISKRYMIDQEIKELESEIARMEASNENLGKIINYLESDQFVEEQARLNMGLKRPGEEVVVIDSTGHIAKTENNIDGQTRGEKEYSNPVRWWRYFFQNKKGT